MLMPVVYVQGNAVALHAGVLVSAPLLADGSIEQNWGEVDLFSVDEEVAQACIAGQLRLNAGEVDAWVEVAVGADGSLPC